MDEIFGKVTAILFAAAVFAGMPLIYMNERAKSAEQMYLLAMNTEFVDSVCNTGFLTMEMYRQFCRKISAVSGICEIHIVRAQKEIVYEDGAYFYENTFYDEEDIISDLEQYGVYEFKRGDYIRAAITKSKSIFSIPGIKDDTVNVYYGGTVRYEDF